MEGQKMLPSDTFLGLTPDRRQDALAGYLGHLGVAEKIQFAHMFVNDPFAQPTFWQDQ